MTPKQGRIDTPDKIEAWFMGYNEAVQILRNYKMRGAVALLEECLQAKRKVIETGIQLMGCIEDFKKNKLENK